MEASLLLTASVAAQIRLLFSDSDFVHEDQKAKLKTETHFPLLLMIVIDFIMKVMRTNHLAQKKSAVEGMPRNSCLHFQHSYSSGTLSHPGFLARNKMMQTKRAYLLSDSQTSLSV